MIVLTVPGEPVPKARARRSAAGGWYTPKETRDAEAAIAITVKAAMSRHGITLDDTSRFSVALAFYVTTKKRHDIDNLAKLVLDACNGIVWKDDSQVDRLLVERHYDTLVPGQTYIDITPRRTP